MLLTGALCGAGTANSFKLHGFTSGFYWGLCCSIFNFLYVKYCRSVSVLLSLCFWSLHSPPFFRFTASDLPFRIFKLFFWIYSRYSARTVCFDSSCWINSYFLYWVITYFIITISRRITSSMTAHQFMITWSEKNIFW